MNQKKKEEPNSQKKTIEQIAKEALELTKEKSISLEQNNIESKKIIESFGRKKMLESLRICSEHQFFNNTKPDTYSVST